MRPSRFWLVLFATVLILLLFGQRPALAQQAAAQLDSFAAEEAVPAGAALAPGPAAPPGIFYVNPFWFAIAAITIAVWLYATSWVNDDARGVGLDFGLYTSMMMGAGAIGLLLVLLVHAAFSFLMVVIVAGTFSVYMVLRNRFVPERHKLFGSQHLGQIISRMPGVSKLSTLQEESEAETPGCSIMNKAGVSLSDLIVEEPEKAPAVDQLQELVLEAAVTHSSTLRLQPGKGCYEAHVLKDGVNYQLSTIETPIAQLAIGATAGLLGLASGLRLKPGRGPLSTELPSLGQIALDTTISATEGKPALRIDLPDWTHNVYRGGLEALGMHEAIMKRVQTALQQPRGMLVISGPAASGCTSTLYAMASALDIFTTDIAFIEARPEFEMPQVHRWTMAKDTPFPTLYEEVMREGPNVIVMGALTNADQARLLLGFSSKEGRVLALVNAPDAPEAVLTLVRLAQDPDLVASSITCVLTQRLVRKLCTNCREAKEPRPEQIEQLHLGPAEVGTWYKAVGCDACLKSGYNGRTAIFGMLILTDPVIAAMKKPDASHQTIAQAAGKAAFRTMLQDGVSKVTAGITTLEEVIRALQSAPVTKGGEA